MLTSHKINIEFENVTTATLNLNDLEEGKSKQHHRYGSYSKSTLVAKGHGTNEKDDIDNKSSLSIDSNNNNNNNNNDRWRWRSYISYYIPILHPFGPFRCFWNAAVCVSLIYTCIEIPVSLAFNVELDLTDVSGIVGFIIDILLLIDILITFRTAYFDKLDRLRLIIDECEIAKRYLFGWFIVDLLTSIPFEFMVSTSNTSNIIKVVKAFRVFRFVRIIKILRLFKMIKYFDGFMSQFVIRELLIVLKFFKVFALMVLFAHLAACTWFFIGYTTIDNATGSWVSVQFDTTDISVINSYSTFTKYSYAWYWAVVTLFTTGYGDIVATPGNKAEQWVVSICILVGTCFFAYFIGTLTSLITEGDRIKSVEIQKLEEAQAFCDQKKLPRELSRAILTHIRYHCGYNYVFDENELIQSLPPYLQNDIHSYLAQTILMQLDFFKSFKKNLQILGQISLKMRSISCNENYCLFQRSDRAKEIYIQRTGESIIDYHDGTTQLLKRGDVIGERSIFSPKRKHTVKCHTFSEFYVLCVQDIVNILQTEYPTTWRKRWRKMAKNLKNAIKKQKKYIRQVDFNFHNKNKEKEKSPSPQLQESNALHAFINQPSTINTHRSSSKHGNGIKSVQLNGIGGVDGSQLLTNNNNNNPRKAVKQINKQETNGNDGNNDNDNDNDDEHNPFKLDPYAKSMGNVINSRVKSRDQRSRSMYQLPSLRKSTSNPTDKKSKTPKITRKKTRFGIFIKRNSLDRDDAIHRSARKRGNTNNTHKDKLNHQQSFYDHGSEGISSSKDSSDDSGDIVPHDYDYDDNRDANANVNVDVDADDDEEETIQTSNTHTHHYDDIVAGVDKMEQLFKQAKSKPRTSLDAIIAMDSMDSMDDDGKFKKEIGHITHMTHMTRNSPRKKKISGKSGGRKGGKFGGKKRRGPVGGKHKKIMKNNINNTSSSSRTPKGNNFKISVRNSKEMKIEKEKMTTINSLSSMTYNNNSNSNSNSSVCKVEHSETGTQIIYDDDIKDSQTQTVMDTKKKQNHVKFKDEVENNDHDDGFIITEDYDNDNNDDINDVNHVNQVNEDVLGNLTEHNSDSTRL